MKSTTLTVLTLLVAMTASTHARQDPKDLQPSLTFLDPVSVGMPSVLGVPFYLKFPDSQGLLSDSGGHAPWVRAWFRRLEPVLPKIVQIDRRLRDDVGVYADTVREEGAEVLGTAKNLTVSLRELNTATSGAVLKTLHEYNNEIGALRRARDQFNSATKDAEAAGYTLEGSDAAATECNLLIERTKADAEQAALHAKMEKDMAFLNAAEKAIDALAGGVTGVAGYLEDNLRGAAKAIIVEALHSDTREALYALEAKIAGIDKALAEVKCKPQTAALKAAKANLEARMIGVLVPFGRMLDHRVKAWQKLDELAALNHPATRKPLPFFAALQDYNKQVHFMGNVVYKRVGEYLDFLSSDPVSRGPLIRTYVDEDIKLVETERRPAENWKRDANATRLYLRAYDDWYRGEVQRAQTIVADFREGRHLDFVDRMVARATRELGGTVSYTDIIR
jgi:hypothetical protein